MPQKPDVRWRQRLQSFGSAFSRLASANEIAEAILHSFTPRFADLLTKLQTLASQEP